VLIKPFNIFLYKVYLNKFNMPYVLTNEQRKRIAKPSIVIPDSEDEYEPEHVQVNQIQPSYGEQINDSPPTVNNETSSPILNGFTQRSQLRNSQQLLESKLQNSDNDGADQLSEQQSKNGSSNNTFQGLASRYASEMSQIVSQTDKISNMPIQNGTHQMFPPNITNDSNSGSRSLDILNLSNNSCPTTSRDFRKQFKQYNTSAQQKHMTMQSIETGDFLNSNNTQHVNQTNKVDHNNNLPPSQSDTRRKSARTTPPVNYNNTRPYNSKKSTPTSTTLSIHTIAHQSSRESS
jgi:hypothetical protein